MISILSLKLSLLSITELKYLKLDTTSMGSLFLLTGTKTFVVKFVLAFSINHFVLPAFVSRKLSLHHSFKSETCEKHVANESSFNSNPKSAMSLANLKRQVRLQQFSANSCSSYIMENNMGERTHHWRAPEISTTSSDI